MPKCCKCGARVEGSFHLSNIEEGSINLGVKAFYLNKAGSNNTELFCYCKTHFEQDVLQLEFVKNEVAKVQQEKRNVENANAALTKEKTDLQTQLDARVKEVQDLKNQFDATTKEQEKTRAERETLSGELKKTTEQLNALKQELKQQKDLVATKDKEIADVRAENLEKAKLHASVKIGLDFSKYHEIPTLLLKWQPWLPEFDQLNVLKGIHEQIQGAFLIASTKQQESVLNILKDLSQKKEKKLQATIEANKKYIEVAKLNWEDPEVVFSEAAKRRSLNPLESELSVFEHRLEQLRMLMKELNLP